MNRMKPNLAAIAEYRKKVSYTWGWCLALWITTWCITLTTMGYTRVLCITLTFILGPYATTCLYTDVQRLHSLCVASTVTPWLLQFSSCLLSFIWHSQIQCTMPSLLSECLKVRDCLRKFIVIIITWSVQPEPPAVAIVRENSRSSASCRASVAVTPVSRQIWWVQVVDGRPQARLHSCEGRSHHPSTWCRFVGSG